MSNELSETDALELRNSGADYLMLGQHENALRHLSKSLEYEPGNTLALGLIDTYYRETSYYRDISYHIDMLNNRRANVLTLMNNDRNKLFVRQCSIIGTNFLTAWS